MTKLADSTRRSMGLWAAVAALLFSVNTYAQSAGAGGGAATGGGVGSGSGTSGFGPGAGTGTGTGNTGSFGLGTDGLGTSGTDTDLTTPPAPGVVQQPGSIPGGAGSLPGSAPFASPTPQFTTSPNFGGNTGLDSGGSFGN